MHRRVFHASLDAFLRVFTLECDGDANLGPIVFHRQHATQPWTGVGRRCDLRLRLAADPSVLRYRPRSSRSATEGCCMRRLIFTSRLGFGRQLGNNSVRDNSKVNCEQQRSSYR